jgi:hypothetical protein
MNLKNDNNYWAAQALHGTVVTALSMYAYYNVEKEDSSVHRIDAYGKYLHAEDTVSPNVSFSYSAGGVSVDISAASSSNYGDPQTAQATLRF